MSILNNAPVAAPAPAGAPASPPAGAPASPPAAPPAVVFPDNWKEGLPEDLRGDPSLGVVNDIPSLAKSFINAQKMVGADKIQVPGKHATDEDWGAVFQKLGLPKDVAEYGLAKAKDSKLEDAFVDKFKTSAHAAGILPRHAQKMLDWFNQEYAASETALQSQITNAKAAGEAALKKEWGEAYQLHTTAANLAVKEFGGDELFKVLKDSGVDSNPEIVKAFAKIGLALKESDVKGLVPRGTEGAVTPDQAMEKYNQIMGDSTHAYHKAEHPSHKAAVEEVSRLFGAAFPSSSS